MVLTGLMVWCRSRQIRFLAEPRLSGRVPASGLFNSLAMLQKIQSAFPF